MGASVPVRKIKSDIKTGDENEENGDEADGNGREDVDGEGEGEAADVSKDKMIKSKSIKSSTKRGGKK